MPDERCRVMRRRLARREQLVRSRSRAKNEIHAVLMRRLKGRPPVSDLFGVKGRKWLRGLELPVEEAETVESALRHVEFLDGEIAAVERLIAREALRSPEARRLMTVPGVNVICAATFLAAVGDIRRFRSSRQLVAYLGLDPRACASPAQSPPAQAGSPSGGRRPSAGRWSRRPGRSSKGGASSGRAETLGFAGSRSAARGLRAEERGGQRSLASRISLGRLRSLMLARRTAVAMKGAKILEKPAGLPRLRRVILVPPSAVSARAYVVSIGKGPWAVLFARRTGRVVGDLVGVGKWPAEEAGDERNLRAGGRRRRHLPFDAADVLAPGGGVRRIRGVGGDFCARALDIGLCPDVDGHGAFLHLAVSVRVVNARTCWSRHGEGGVLRPSASLLQWRPAVATNDLARALAMARGSEREPIISGRARETGSRLATQDRVSQRGPRSPSDVPPSACSTGRHRRRHEGGGPQIWLYCWDRGRKTEGSRTHAHQMGATVF